MHARHCRGGAPTVVASPAAAFSEKASARLPSAGMAAGCCCASSGACGMKRDGRRRRSSGERRPQASGGRRLQASSAAAFAAGELDGWRCARAPARARGVWESPRLGASVWAVPGSLGRAPVGARTTSRQSCGSRWQRGQRANQRGPLSLNPSHRFPPAAPRCISRALGFPGGPASREAVPPMSCSTMCIDTEDWLRKLRRPAAPLRAVVRSCA